MSNRFVLPLWQLFNRNGVPLSGASLGFYVSGTTSMKTVFADNELTVPLANPVTADADGEFPEIFLDEGLYKVVLKDAQGVSRWTADPVQSATDSARDLLTDLVFADDFDTPQDAAQYALGKQFFVPNDTTVKIVVGEDVNTIADALDDIAGWDIGQNANVEICIDGEHHEPNPVSFAHKHLRGVKIGGASQPLTPKMLPNGHSVVDQGAGKYAYTMQLDTVTGIEEGDVVCVPHIGFDGTAESRQPFPFPFAEVSARMSDQGHSPVRQGYITTNGTTVTLTDTNKNPSADAVAADYVRAGQLFYANGQFRVITSVASLPPLNQFELDFPLERDLNGITAYWYVFDADGTLVHFDGTSLVSPGNNFTSKVEPGGAIITRAGVFPILDVQDESLKIRGNCMLEVDSPWGYLPPSELLCGAYEVNSVDENADTVTFTIETHEGDIGTKDVSAKVKPPVLGLRQTDLVVLKDRLVFAGSGIAVERGQVRVGNLALVGREDVDGDMGIALIASGPDGAVKKQGELAFVGFQSAISADNGASAVLQKMYASHQTGSAVIAVGSHVDMRYSCVTHTGGYYCLAVTNGSVVFADCVGAGGSKVGAFATSGAILNVERARICYTQSTALQVQGGSYASGVELYLLSNVETGQGVSRGSSVRVPGSWTIGGVNGGAFGGAQVENANAMYFACTLGFAASEGSALESQGVACVGNLDKGVSLARGCSADLSDSFICYNADDGVLASANSVAGVDDMVTFTSKDLVVHSTEPQHNGGRDIAAVSGARITGTFYVNGAWPTPTYQPSYNPTKLGSVGLTGEFVNNEDPDAPDPFLFANGGVQLGGAGQKLIYARSGEVTLASPPLAAGAKVDEVDGVTGAEIGDIVTVTPSGSHPNNVAFQAWVSDAGEVTIRAFNYSASQSAALNVPVSYDVRRYA